MGVKKILVVTSGITRHTGGGDIRKAEVHVGSKAHDVDVVNIERLHHEYAMRGRRYDLVILPKASEESEEVKLQAYLLTEGFKGQVLYL